MRLSALGRLSMRRIGVLIVVGFLGACAGTDKPKPTDLGANVALMGVRSAWNANIGTIAFPLDVRVVGNTVWVAGSDGVVAAIDARTGGDVWRTRLATKLTAGVGSDGRYAAVVSHENELIVLDNGKQTWRQQLGALTMTSPLVAGERVFVLSADRTVSAFDAASGKKLWQQQRTGDALVLAQSGVLLAVGDTLVVGQGGRMVGLNPQNGSTRWDASIANSRGTNEVERLVDLVSGTSREGDNVCVRSFQSAVGCIDTSRGRTVWSKAATGSVGIVGDATAIFGTESDGKLVSWRRADGDRLWTSERLRYRTLSAPMVVGRALVVGDDSGTLHFLSRENGSPLNRLATDGTVLAAAPVLAGANLIVVTRRGGIFAFRPE